jgi:hypothetical protein
MCQNWNLFDAMRGSVGFAFDVLVMLVDFGS